jgi:hypothetical protein
MRVTQKHLYEMVKILNNNMPGFGFELDVSNGGYRLLDGDSKNYVSGRLGAKELECYISGMIEAAVRIRHQ